MDIEEITKRLYHYEPGAEYSIEGNDLNTLVWHGTNAKPDMAMLESFSQSDVNKTHYVSLRKNAVDGYKSIEEQLDMMHSDQVNGTTTWKDHCTLVKSTYPKP